MRISNLGFFWVLTFLYLVYIVIEFAFNFELLGVSSGFRINKIEDLGVIELVGKSLSSIGAGVFVYTLLSNMMKGAKNFYFIMGLALSAAVTFFFTQEKVINHLIASTNVEFRDNSEVSLILKTGILNGSLTGEEYGLPSTENKHQKMAFLTGFGLLMQGSVPKFNELYDERDSIYPMIFRKEVEDSQEELYEEYKKYNAEVHKYWYKYKGFYDDVDYKYHSVIRKVKYPKIISDLNYLKSSHERYANDYATYRRSRMQVANTLAIYYMDLAGCEDYDCVIMGRGRKFFTSHLDKVIKGRKDLYSHFMKQCTFSTANNGTGSVYIDGKLHLQKPSEINGRNNNYVCHIDSRELYDMYHANYERIAFEKFGIRSLAKYKSLNDFANTTDVKNIILKNSGDYGIDLDNVEVGNVYIDYSDEVSFKRSIEKFIKASYEAEYEKTMMDKYGVVIPLGISNINDFVKVKGVREVLLDETRGLVDINDWGINLSRSAFLDKSVKVLPNQMADKFSNKNLRNDYGELIAKAVVLPPILIALSLFFAVFNLINLLFIVLGRFYFHLFGFYSFNIFRIAVYALAVYIPLSFGGGILDDPLMIGVLEELEARNMIFYYSFKWVLAVYHFI